jgi:hypothetical protein
VPVGRFQWFVPSEAERIDDASADRRVVFDGENALLRG